MCCFLWHSSFLLFLATSSHGLQPTCDGLHLIASLLLVASCYYVSQVWDVPWQSKAQSQASEIVIFMRHLQLSPQECLHWNRSFEGQHLRKAAWEVSKVGFEMLEAQAGKDIITLGTSTHLFPIPNCFASGGERQNNSLNHHESPCCIWCLNCQSRNVPFTGRSSTGCQASVFFATVQQQTTCRTNLLSIGGKSQKYSPKMLIYAWIICCFMNEPAKARTSFYRTVRVWLVFHSKATSFYFTEDWLLTHSSSW